MYEVVVENRRYADTPTLGRVHDEQNIRARYKCASS